MTKTTLNCKLVKSGQLSELLKLCQQLYDSGYRTVGDPQLRKNIWIVLMIIPPKSWDGFHSGDFDLDFV